MTPTTTTLTKEGSARLEQIARDGAFTTDAGHVILDALVRGGGTQAQFSHPDLGGMGQWSRGGMVMIGDMFNNQLKTRVDRLCTEVSDLLRDPALIQTSADGTTGASAREHWWPARLGQPGSSGSQNGSRYAYFPQEKRLAVEEEGSVHLYDTGDHHIHGVSQQQGGGQDLAFQSQNGTIQLHDLAKVEDAAVGTGSPQPASQQAGETPSDTPRPSQDTVSIIDPPSNDIFDKIERLHDLLRKGILSEADFADKKKELLSRI